MPAGTLEDAETLEKPVIREAYKETGLVEEIQTFLSSRSSDFAGQGYCLEERHYYHPDFRVEAPERWLRYKEKPSSGRLA